MSGLDAWRCPFCGRILARLRLAPGSVVEVKCHSCNTLATLDMTGQVPTVRTEKAAGLAIRTA